MKEALANIDRRTLLIGGGVGIGLGIVFVAWPRHLAGDLATRKGEHAFGAFLKIGRDGRVTVAVPQVETGQGVWTALPQIVADELGAAWETVAVEPAPLAAGYANPLAGEEGWLEGIGRLRGVIRFAVHHGRNNFDDVTKFIRRARISGVDLIGFRYIAFNKDTHSATCGDLFHRFLVLVFDPVGDNDIGTLFGKRNGGGLPDSETAPGDEGGFSFKWLVHKSWIRIGRWVNQRIGTIFQF